MSYAFRIVNVFAESPLAGNPLCVFENGEGLSDETMQALALQFNLSETTFVLPPTGDATARVRIFTPTFEMPFAGHPTLGTAHVVRELTEAGDRVQLEMKAGVIPVEALTRDVSSTVIRARLASGQGIDDLVPAAVARHIEQNDLYRTVDELHG
jgi:PhzF family phenazine biosynthesis protein